MGCGRLQGLWGYRARVASVGSFCFYSDDGRGAGLGDEERKAGEVGIYARPQRLN